MNKSVPTPGKAANNSCEKGLVMNRIPASLREQVNETLGTRTAFYTTGVELRFRIVGDQARICLQAEEMEEAQVACIYMGSFQGGRRLRPIAAESLPTVHRGGLFSRTGSPCLTGRTIFRRI